MAERSGFVNLHEAVSLPQSCRRVSVVAVTTQNPFPGMNPFFEQRWPSVHTALIMYFCDAVQEKLPSDLVARPEAVTVTLGASEKPTTYRPDVQIQEPLSLKEPSAVVMAPEPPPTQATAPIRVFLDEEIERWIEIRDTTGRLITVLELLSPSNKLETAERDRYVRKRNAFLSGGANLVEVDLVRQGTSLFLTPVRNVVEQATACYGVCVLRATRPAEREVYPIRLRERLPVIRIPLRPTDTDVILDLQPLVNQCHERGRYHLLDYRLELHPPLNAEDAAWATGILRERGLI